MFTKLASEIEFDDIETFCREWGEGVRVEYKSQIAHLPKIISSFANTQGGILIIGVETDKNSSAKRDIPGIPNEDGIRERIEQSATDGIYPANLPEIIIRDVPGQGDRVVVVVRVEESQQAPHAIQNSTKVYVRKGSTTPPYELAEVDRIEHLLKRREEPQRISRRILERIEERVQASVCRSQLERPNLGIYARPVFPYRPIITPLGIYEYMVQHPLIPATPRNADLSTKRVTGGTYHLEKGDWLRFWELNEHGIIFCREGLHRERMRNDYSPREDHDSCEEYLTVHEIGTKIFRFLGVAVHFFTRCKYAGNLEVTVKLDQVGGERLLFTEDLQSAAVERRQTAETEILASTLCLPRDLQVAEGLSRVLIALLDQVFWVFNVAENEWKWRDRWRKYVAENGPK